MDDAGEDRFESASLYKSIENQNAPYEEYRSAQIIRHRGKAQKKREEQYYKSYAEQLLSYKTNTSKMLCMGTRNNHERDCFRKLLDIDNVYSIDIAPGSQADYVLDFGSLPKEWDGEWDFIFSNALDHAKDATECIDEWIRVLKPGGIMLLNLTDDGGIPSSIKLTASDCNTFNKKQVFKFLEKRRVLVSGIQWPDLLIQKI